MGRFFIGKHFLLYLAKKRLKNEPLFMYLFFAVVVAAKF